MPAPCYTGPMTFRAIFTSTLFLFACGDDATPRSDAGNRDGGAIRDAGSPPDCAPSDAGGGSDASADAAGADANTSACDCIAMALTWGAVGGRTPSVRESEVSPCNTFAHEERTRDGMVVNACSNMVPCVGDALIMRDLLAALDHPDVTAAFAARDVVYGIDRRPSDGTVLRIARGGDEFFVGAPCKLGSAGCVEIPPGVQALASLLGALQMARLAETDCAAVFP